jgi:hypothetical protein
MYAWTLAVVAAAASGAWAADDPRNGFLLGGTAQVAQDPENPANQVVVIRTDVDPFFGTVSRAVNAKIQDLDNMVEFKAWFQNPKSCTGGSPRIQLAIDTDGDGKSNGNAFGYYGAPPNFRNCPMGTWMYEDFTGAGDIAITGAPLFPSTGGTTPNEELEWDLTQFGGGFYNTWSQVEAFFGAIPNHVVCSVALVDDTFNIPNMTGTAYYDLFSAGRGTFRDSRDVVGHGFAMGCRSDPNLLEVLQMSDPSHSATSSDSVVGAGQVIGQGQGQTGTIDRFERIRRLRYGLPPEN